MSFGARSFTTVSFLTLVSRILGFVREQLIASYAGAGPFTDAFFLAWRLPNVFRRLFGEGAFSVSFIPIYAEELKKGPLQAKQFANHVFSILTLSLLGLVLFFELFMPYLIYGIAPGFTDNPEQFAHTILYARIMFPYILLISLVAFGAGILNTVGHFFAASLSPIVLNLTSILSLLLFQHLIPKALLETLSYAVVVGGCVQLLILYIGTMKVQLHFKFVRPQLSPTIKKLFQKMVPGALGAGVYQINLFISDIIASFIPAAVSYLNYADRINQLPLGTIGVAMSMVLLPHLARCVQGTDKQALHRAQEKALIFSLFLCIPAAVALYVLSSDIIEAVYYRNAFTATAWHATAKTLAAFSIGLPAYVIIKVLNTNFFARGDTKTPVKVATICLIINALLTIFFAWLWQYQGIAFATSVTAWINVCLLASLLYRAKQLHFQRGFLMRLAKITLSAAVMGYCLTFINTWLMHQQIAAIYKILYLIIAGLGIYMLFVYVAKAVDLHELKRSFKKKA